MHKSLNMAITQFSSIFLNLQLLEPVNPLTTAINSNTARTVSTNDELSKRGRKEMGESVFPFRTIPTFDPQLESSIPPDTLATKLIYSESVRCLIIWATRKVSLHTREVTREYNVKNNTKGGGNRRQSHASNFTRACVMYKFNCSSIGSLPIDRLWRLKASQPRRFNSLNSLSEEALPSRDRHDQSDGDVALLTILSKLLYYFLHIRDTWDLYKFLNDRNSRSSSVVSKNFIVVNKTYLKSGSTNVHLIQFGPW